MKKIKAALAALTAVLTVGIAAVWTATAEETYDINDVAQALRDACVPENQIQQMLNVYQYCEKDENGIYYGDYYYRYDETVWMIEGFGESINDVINQYMDEALKVQEEILATATTTTTTATGSGNSTTTTTTTTAKTFEQMTMDEKIDYLLSLPEAERKAFLDNLSIDEKQSILAQMSMGSQAAVLDQLTQIFEGLGFHVSVDDMQQGQINLSVRDDQGNLVDSSSMGVIVEDTGWNLTGWFALASVLVLVSMGGIGYVMYRSSKNSEEEQNG